MLSYFNIMNGEFSLKEIKFQIKSGSLSKVNLNLVKFINPKKSLDFFELRLTIENESNIFSRQCKEIVHFQCQV